MTWDRKRLIDAGKFAAQGLCPECGADLVVALINRNKHGVYYCSRKRCMYERRAVPRSSNLYAGPDK